jgi:hypothetical protein
VYSVELLEFETGMLSVGVLPPLDSFERLKIVTPAYELLLPGLPGQQVE